MPTLIIASYGGGLYRAQFDPKHLSLTLEEKIPTDYVPTYVRHDQGCFALSYKDGGGLALEGKKSRQPGISYTHFALSPDGAYLAAADYHQGATDLFKVGDTLQKTDRLLHTGSGPNSERQTSPHIHFVGFTPDGEYVLAADLGCDLIRAFSYQEGELVPYAPLTTAIRPGAGPRHFTFSQDGKFLYLVNELDSTIDCFRYEKDGLAHFQTIATLKIPDSGSLAAAIRLSASGRSLIATNRGQDGVAYFDRDLQSGRLTLKAIVPCLGHPRDAIIEGSLVFVAALADHQVQLFVLDEADQTLSDSGITLQVPRPVSLAII